MIDAKAIKETIDLRQVIADDLGVNYNGQIQIKLSCPFHHDKTPSFLVGQERYHCFGCGKKGDIFSWLAFTRGLTFMQAATFLTKGNPNSPFESSNLPQLQLKEKKAPYSEIDITQSGFFYRLNSKIMSYYESLNERYVRNGMEFIATDNNDGRLMQYLYSQCGYSITDMERSGNFRFDTNNMLHFRFNNCALIPIKNRHGLIQALAGRRLDDSSEGPKYVNSAKSPTFVKSRSLFGWHTQTKRPDSNDLCHVVEGYFDVYHCQQFDHDIYSCMGVSPSREQLNILEWEYAYAVYCPDGDEAGRNAIIDLAKIAIDYPFLSFHVLPDGKDPDDLTKEEWYNLHPYWYKYMNNGIVQVPNTIEYDLENFHHLTKPYGLSNLKAGYPHYNVIDWVCEAWPQYKDEIHQALLTMKNNSIKLDNGNRRFRDEDIKSFIKSWARPCKKVRENGQN